MYCIYFCNLHCQEQQHSILIDTLQTPAKWLNELVMLSLHVRKEHSSASSSERKRGGPVNVLMLVMAYGTVWVNKCPSLSFPLSFTSTFFHTLLFPLTSTLSNVITVRTQKLPLQRGASPCPILNAERGAIGLYSTAILGVLQDAQEINTVDCAMRTEMEPRILQEIHIGSKKCLAWALLFCSGYVGVTWGLYLYQQGYLFQVFGRLNVVKTQRTFKSLC